MLTQSSGASAVGQSMQRDRLPTFWHQIFRAFTPMLAPITGPISSARPKPPPGWRLVTPAPASPIPPQKLGQRIFNRGVAVPGPHMLEQPLDPRNAPRDPHAMRRGAGSIPKQCSSLVALPPCRESTPSSQTPLSVFRPSIFAPSQDVGSGNARTLSVTPTVQQFQYEATASSAPSALFVTGGAESGAVSRTMVSAPTDAPLDQTLTFAPNSGAMSFGWISPPSVPNMTSWPAQSYTVTLTITQPNANVKLTQITLYRVDSNGGPGTAGIAHVADKTGLNQPLNGATYSYTFDGTAQTASATDRFAVKFIVSYSGTTTQSVSYRVGSGSGSGVNVDGSGILPTSTTGAYPWSTFYGGQLPGQGRYLFNVGNGNLLVSTTDVDVPSRGLNLAFRRTYNSQSQHDANNTDASVPSNYGDGWTSTFDAHLAYHGSNVISVYDTDGTRIDYQADQYGNWIPSKGVYATIKWDGSCGYQWFKPNGTVYYFYSPDLNESTTCKTSTQGTFPKNSAYGGRLYQIWGRNYNNSITLTYSWSNGDASNPANLTGIAATHSDGDKLVLVFGPGNTGGPPELQSITRPDNLVINYYYDAVTGTTLSAVDLPAGLSSTRRVRYAYKSTGAPHMLDYTQSPQSYQPVGNPEDGGDATHFGYDSSNRLTQTYDVGTVNFTPSDGTNTALQSGASGAQTWTTSNIGWGSTTQLADTLGHNIQWTTDGSPFWHVTRAQRWTSNPAGQGIWEVTGFTWDAINNLVATIDPRGMLGATPDPTYETDYAYDSNGDLTERALPSGTLNNGTYRPTYLISYDSNHNVIATCDPVKSNSKGLNWTGPAITSATPCPSEAGAAQYVWTTPSPSPTGVPSPEPHGELSKITTPNGYSTAISYSPANEGSGNLDVGLPTSIQGQSMSQSSDSSTPTRTPTETIKYDAYGDIVSDDSGNGAKRYAYDTMHRRITVTDADTVASYSCYNNDGTVFYTETASQHAAEPSAPAPCIAPLPSTVTPPPKAVAFTYDGDGNQITETHHYGNINGTTHRWYDAADRLVEEQLPLDTTTFPNSTVTHDLYPSPWMTRYLYDITGTMLWSDPRGNGTYAFGNLYKIQEYLPSTPGIAANTAPSSQVWTDVRGWAYEGLDRVLRSYEFALGNVPSMSFEYNANNSSMGLLYQVVQGDFTDPASQKTTYTYLANGWINQLTYTNDGGATPTKTFTYDADGRPTQLTSSTLGSESRTYDSDGNVLSVQEPNSYQSPATTSYTYYSDGRRKTIGVSSADLSMSTAFQYTYRPDGLLQTVQPSWISNGSYSFTYTNAGRRLTQSDPYTGQSIQVYGQTGSPAFMQKLSAQSTTYDSYGRIFQVVLPEGYTYGSFVYDGEDEQTSYSLTKGFCNYSSTVVNCDPGVVRNIFSARGELLSSSPSGGSNGAIQSADGFLCAANSYGAGCLDGFDARNDAITSHLGIAYSYDIGGRQTQMIHSGTITRAYDADNHLVSQANNSSTTFVCPSVIELPCDDNNLVTQGVSATYTWGPSGHPAKFGSTSYGGGYPSTYWEHWDAVGGQILLEGPNGSIPIRLNIAMLGVSNATNGVTVSDRDPFGNLVATHTGKQFSSWSGFPPPNPMYKIKPLNSTGTGSNLPASQGPDPQQVSSTLSTLRIDGYVDSINGVSFQGVRQADANTTEWMTPDFFGGFTERLISQQPYAWNGNNALLNEDPTGYDNMQFIIDTGPPCAGGALACLLPEEGLADSSTIVAAASGPDDGPILGPNAKSFAYLKLPHSTLLMLRCGFPHPRSDAISPTSKRGVAVATIYPGLEGRPLVSTVTVSPDATNYTLFTSLFPGEGAGGAGTAQYVRVYAGKPFTTSVISECSAQNPEPWFNFPSTP